MTGTPWRDATLMRGGSRVLFGLGYDDERVELEVLPRGRVLVIAAAGEVAAALASIGDEVEAIDINPEQLAYAEARVAGGPTVSGSAEQLLRAGRSTLRAVQPVWAARRVRRLLELPASRAVPIWQQRFATPVLRGLLAAALGRRGAIAVLVPTGLRAGIPERLPQRILDAIERRLGDQGNRFLHRLLVGEELQGWRLPTVQDGAITWHVGDVLAHLEAAAPGTYDGISLSNVGDAADADWVERLRRAAVRALAPGGAAVLRTIANDGPDEDRDLADRDRSGLWGAIRLWRAEGRIDEASRHVRASQERVWHALTDAEQVAGWLPPHGMRAEVRSFDVREGGPIDIVLSYDEAGHGKTDDATDVVVGTVASVRDGRSLEWRTEFVADDPSLVGTMRMRWSLTPAGQGTVVRVVATDVPDGIAPADHAVGLRSTLAGLARLVESHDGP